MNIISEKSAAVLMGVGVIVLLIWAVTQSIAMGSAGIIIFGMGLGLFLGLKTLS